MFGRIWPALVIGAAMAVSAGVARADDPVHIAYDPVRTRLGLETRFVAVAFSQSTGKWGWGADFLDSSNSCRLARKNCKAADAEVLVVVGNGFAALALGDDVGAYGFGYGESNTAARRNALAQARKYTKNVYIAVCVDSYGNTDE